MKTKFCGLLIALIFSGCAMTPRQADITRAGMNGAAVGAGFGAMGGYFATEDPVTGAVVGAIVGAGLGIFHEVWRPQHKASISER
ncbi:MAG: hypothetical protein A3C84_01565 [Candidatus Ryanbacteria bacterium RIFCSPHIGHO2_02_FULL_48_12]|uniref:Uncharacterized protein n=1 Tax=Candidatus Ryanbacteria bacterium RIFCSPHIGHO2_01_FULL_48_27 TaxID=1802115 RepID=A0A1G2G7L5_9BACT|nr:MAG: hypothetical protein A2756_06300 [Candidatus Ryanbacteria bacterium RIFCSPHIGHO2_01_FULL_48_27]OGZ49171.1 MAG: hypothetical protein A3C84_01565 [Candidatus Ryanbacteria bacterium RIFCSPHIGHO2_02_FULL_48_12]